MMRTLLIIIFISAFSFAQTPSLSLAGFEIELGMDKEELWLMLNKDLDVMEDDPGNFYISDRKGNPVGVIIFEGETAVRVIKDWGTAYKTNAGAVFKILWNIFKQYGSELELTKVIPNEVYTPSGEKYSLNFYLNEYKYIEINIFRNVLISEILEDPNYKESQN